SDFIDVAMEIQRQLAAVDVDIRIVPIKPSEALKRVSEVDVYFTFVPSPVPVEAVGYFYTTQGVDTLFARLSETPDESKRKLIFDEIEDRVLDDAPMTVLFWQPLLSAYRSQYCDYHMINPFTGLDKIRPCS